MGYNTTIVVMNDALSAIESDPEFGKKLVEAIVRRHRMEDKANVSARGGGALHCNAAVVIESHHSSDDVLVRVGGNTGEVIRD